MIRFSKAPLCFPTANGDEEIQKMLLSPAVARHIGKWDNSKNKDELKLEM